MLSQGNPYAPPPHEAPLYQPPAPPTTGAGLAATGLALGIMALVLVALIAPLRLWPDLIGLVGAMSAVVCGHVTLGRARGDANAGQGLAMAALIIGYVALGLGLLHLIGLVAFSAELRARFPRFR